MTRPKTIVEFVDTDSHDVAHIARRIRINGEEVLVKAGSINLTFDPNEATKLTLTILPTEVHFNHDPEKPQPLQVGDRVRVKKNPKYVGWSGDLFPCTLAKKGDRGKIVDLDDDRGNLVIQVDGAVARNYIAPDSVKRAES